MRKAKSDNLQNVNFRLSPDEIAQLDQQAERFGMSRSQYLRNMVLNDLAMIEAFDEVDYIPNVIKVGDLVNWIKSKSIAPLKKLEDQDETQA